MRTFTHAETRCVALVKISKYTQWVHNKWSMFSELVSHTEASSRQHPQASERRRARRARLQKSAMSSSNIQWFHANGTEDEAALVRAAERRCDLLRKASA
jgi:hypothetical protein